MLNPTITYSVLAQHKAEYESWRSKMYKSTILALQGIHSLVKNTDTFTTKSNITMVSLITDV